MSKKIERLGSHGDSYELTDEDRKVIGCFRAVGRFAEGASHGERATVEGMAVLNTAANILYSCDYKQRAIICELFRQHMMHDGMHGNKAAPDDVMDRWTRFSIVHNEGHMHQKDAASE